MFDRRVKIFLSIIVLVTAVLLMRAAQVQILNRKTWVGEADKIMSTGELIETSRGRLLDFKGNVLAEDAPCIDACVDYRAIIDPPQDKWVHDIAVARLHERLGDDYSHLSKTQRDDRIKAEQTAVVADIHAMFDRLAELGKMSPDDMAALRESIHHKVEMRRRNVWFLKYQSALTTQPSQPDSWYSGWLDDSRNAPDLDAFEVTVGEERQAHVILPNISNAINNELGKNLANCPGLALRPSVHRYYQYNDLAAQVIGHLSKVLKEDVGKENSLKGELRGYLPNDLIGRSGLEALCEPLLRGTRGKIEHFAGEHARDQTTDAVPGGDVKTSIDIDLQADIQHAFEHVQFKATGAVPWTDDIAMPGAAVVLDVATNQVRAMVSYPTYDLNTLDEDYAKLATDRISLPLLNRATQMALEPGSSVKPMVGISAITQGVFRPDETIECTGYLILGGHTYKTEGRCWTMKSFGFGHHQVPTGAEHPTGFLTFPDALERSCNVFFETLADRLQIDGISYWFNRWGLGRPTGVGIAEISGLIPNQRPIPAALRRSAGWFAGIGQDHVLATPMQMANVAATIARNGIWMRPTLLADRSAIPTTQPDVVDLKLSQVAIALAHQGMINVVNGKAGTGVTPRRNDMIVAGKTGTAQARKLSIPVLDAQGQPIYVEGPVTDQDGKMTVVRDMKRDTPPLGTHEHPNPQIPWYRGSGDDETFCTHSWYIGFAPAENPQIAFAVMVEYGGSGGATAGSIVTKLLDACIEHGYLVKK